MKNNEVINPAYGSLQLNGIEGYNYDAKQISKTLQSIGFNGKLSVSSIQKSEKPYLMAHILT